MKKIIYSFTLLIIICTWASCKKPSINDTVLETTDEIGSDKPPASVTTIDVKVNFPVGMAVNKADYLLSSLSVEAKLNGNGEVNAAQNKGYATIAYIYDKEDRLIMAGFLTDTSATIDAASTAKVLLYFGYGLMLRPHEITGRFINGIDKVPGVTNWINTYTELFKKDQLVLSKAGFSAALKESMVAISKNSSINIRNSSTSDIQVDANDTRSGLQLAESGLSKLTIANTYRRRAHAFLYKTKSKNLAGVENTLISNMAIGTKFDKEEIIDPVGGITSFHGVLGAWIESKAIDFAVSKAGPIDLPLNDDESEATYRVRIVGPGAPGNDKAITNSEINKLTRLEIETFALDFVFPIMMEIVGGGENPADITTKATLKQQVVEPLITTTELMLKASPAIYEEMRKSGNYQAAAGKFAEAFYNGLHGELFESFVNITVSIMEIGAQQKYFIPSYVSIQKQVKRKLGLLDLINKTLLVGDFIKMSSDIASSKTLEEWELKARSSKVSLDPAEATVIPYKQLKLAATVKNIGETGIVHPFFEWKTSGKYGKLSDTKGHTNQLSFSSADSNAYYYSNASAAVLSDGDNLEYVYITAYLADKIIGRDTAVINVKKNQYTITPNGVTLSGKDESQNEVKLYLEKPDGSSDINTSKDVDYKLIWTIGGKYGKLLNNITNNATTITDYNRNSVSYECLDKTTKEGVENVRVRIYSKKKSDAAGAYKLYDEVEGTVKINNDPKKKIFHVGLTIVQGDTVSGPYRASNFSEYYEYLCQEATVAFVPVVKDAVSYSIHFYGFENGYTYSTANQSWTPANLGYYAPASFVAPKYNGSAFCVYYSGGGSASPFPGCNYSSTAGPATGKAEVIVTLK